MAIAPLYSQLAGVLAGFSFAALMALATVRLSTESDQQYVTVAYRPLMCSFFGLLATSLNYALLVGEQGNSGRAAAVDAAAGVGFVAAGSLLVFAILVTLDSVESARPDQTGSASKAVGMIRRILIVAIPPLFVFLFLPALRAHQTAKSDPSFSGDLLGIAAILGVSVSACVSLALLVFYRKLRRRSSGTDLLSVPGLCVSLLSLFATGGIVGFIGRSDILPDFVPLVELGLVVSLGGVTSLAATCFRSGAEELSVENNSEAARIDDGESEPVQDTLDDEAGVVSSPGQDPVVTSTGRQ